MDALAMATEREHCERDCEPQSLEYMEDPYFIQLDGDATPSFDLDEDDELAAAPSPWGDPTDAERDLDTFSLEPYVETEFIVNNRRRRLRIFRKKMHDVRVTFQDLSKPYLARVSSHTNYKKFLGITPQAEEAISAGLASPAGDGTPATPPSELAGLSPEEQERLRAEWGRELARVEDEIATLRTVLQSKIRQSSDLKRKLGITVWKEITEDVNQGLKNVKESQVYQSVETHVGQISKAVTDAPLYQKTESVIKSTAEKTTSILGGITTKLGQMRNSESFRSIEERVGTAYENVKGKVASRSNSTQSFDEALREANRSASGAASPIPENKAFP